MSDHGSNCSIEEICTEELEEDLQPAQGSDEVGLSFILPLFSVVCRKDPVWKLSRSRS